MTQTYPNPFLFLSLPFSFQQINCGGRAYKNGLKQNDIIIAVNNFEVDKHPRTLARHSDDEENKDDCKFYLPSCVNQVNSKEPIV